MPYCTGFYFFGYRNNNYLPEQRIQPYAQPSIWRTRQLYLCSPVIGWPSYTPRYGVPFSSPSTTRRATVEYLTFSTRRNDIVTCRHISIQRQIYAHATIGKVLQEVFCMWPAPYPLLRNGSLNTFPQKQTCGTIGDLLLGNGAVNRLCQQHRLFSVGSMQSGYQRVEFQSWQFRSCWRPRKKLETREREWSESPALD
jgi:hypothetical protein